MKVADILASDAQVYWVIISQDRFYRSEPDQVMVKSRWSLLSDFHHYADHIVHIGEHVETPVLLVDMGQEMLGGDAITTGMRGALIHANDQEFNTLARAWQYALFMRTHRFCGQCGSRMQRVDWEMATHCHNCHHRCYPRVSPCIIVAIYRDQELLLALGTRHKDTGMYSTLAGFVESGESLENAVHREVMEEVGVKVKNLEYFGSQPWPFPHSLMVGYIAEYAGGDICIDDDEICDANWYRFDELPSTPPKLSIAGQLIEEVVNRMKSEV